MKYGSNVHVLKILNGDCHEVEESREQREAPVHRLEQRIEESCHSDTARDRDEASC